MHVGYAAKQAVRRKLAMIQLDRSIHFHFFASENYGALRTLGRFKLDQI